MNLGNQMRALSFLFCRDLFDLSTCEVRSASGVDPSFVHLFFLPSS